MRELNEQEILAWMRHADHRMFRYKIHARLLGTLSLIPAVLLALGLIVWVSSTLDRELVMAALVIIVGINVMVWYRLLTSIWFVGRNYLGISPDELLIVRGDRGTAISFNVLREQNVDWHDRPPIASSSELPLSVDGKRYRIRLMSPYFSLEHFAGFLGLLLERFDDHALSPKDSI